MKYVAFLRAINVSGANMVKMAALKDLFSNMGLSHVSTYLQSGNVVFSTTSISRTRLEETIESRMVSALGLSVKVIVRTQKDVEYIIRNNPFINNGFGVEFLHTTLFKGSVEAVGIEQRSIKKDDLEQYQLSKDCVYLLCPNGYGRTKLNNTNWEKWTKQTATTRNWKTVMAVNELME
jgi:uncharacterized protein (DUF1697 family)